MSILPLMKEAVGRGQIIEFHPLQRMRTLRPLFLTRRAMDELHPELASTNYWIGYDLTDLSPRLAEMDALLHNFAAGQRLVHDNDIKRLVDLNEVWALCARTKKPGIRALGRFIQKDVFLVTNVEDRGGLGEKDNPEFGKTYYGYGQAARICLAQWAGHFQTSAPHSGHQLTDYIGSNCHEKRKFLA